MVEDGVWGTTKEANGLMRICFVWHFWSLGERLFYVCLVTYYWFTDEFYGSSVFVF